MANQLPISAFIIARNEADRIGRAINSVKELAAEVIVVDSGSTDDTLAVAQGLGAKTFFNAWPGYGLQKRFAEDQCAHRWLLNIDADEEVTLALADEIRNLFARGVPEMGGYVIRICDLLPGEEKLAPGVHTNYVLRLYDREKGRFSESPVHDSVILREGMTQLLKYPVLHRSFRSLAHAIDKMNAYTDVQAANLLRKGLRFPMLRLITEFPMAFFKDYILRGYIFRGRRGFVNSVLYGFTRFVRIAKYLEKKEP